MQRLRNGRGVGRLPLKRRSALRFATVAIAGSAVIAAYGWWASDLTQFTWPIRAAFGVPGALLVAAAVRTRRVSATRTGAVVPDGLGSSAPPPRSVRAGSDAWTAGLVVWFSLIAVVVAWELYSFVAQEHHRLPTISHFITDLTNVHSGRVVAFGLWLGAGWIAARG